MELGTPDLVKKLNEQLAQCNIPHNTKLKGWFIFIYIFGVIKTLRYFLLVSEQSMFENIILNHAASTDMM